MKTLVIFICIVMLAPQVFAVPAAHTNVAATSGPRDRAVRPTDSEIAATFTSVQVLARNRLDALIARTTKEATLPHSVRAEVAEWRQVLQEGHAYPLDYGLNVGLLTVVRRGDDFEVLYTTEVSLLLEEDGEPQYEFEQEYHRAVVRNGEVISDERIEIDHPDFALVSRIEADEVATAVKVLFGDPFAAHDSVAPDGNADEARRFPLQSLIAKPSKVEKYAEKHCASGKYNSNYPNYKGNGNGGDCTNFVSQVLEAGGLEFRDKAKASDRKTSDKYWWSNPQKRKEHSISWSTVDGLRNHFRTRFGSASKIVHWDWEDAHVGDVVFFNFDAKKPDSWDHSCIVTTAEETWFGFRLKVSCHSNDRCDKSLYSMVDDDWQVQIVHVP